MKTDTPVCEFSLKGVVRLETHMALREFNLTRYCSTFWLSGLIDTSYFNLGGMKRGGGIRKITSVLF